MDDADRWRSGRCGSRSSSGDRVPAVVLLGLLTVAACSGEGSHESAVVEAPAGPGSSEPTGDLSWRQWGGPSGDFKVRGEILADSWPGEGPPVIWSRPLGTGYSAVVCDRGVVFTIYRDGNEDVIVAYRAEDGAQQWEYRYPARIHDEQLPDYGTGPHATPLVLDDRIVTLSFGGMLHALDFETGRLLWSLDLIASLDGQVIHYGNSASPIAYRDHVIVLVGGSRQAVVALDPEDGSVAWRSGPGTVSYATPIVIEVDGQDQLVYSSEDEIIGVDARNGERLWSHPSLNRNRDNISPPIWGDDGLLWASMQPDGGTRVLHLRRIEGKTEVREVWSSRRINIHFWNALRLGDHVYASIGGQGSVFACVDVRTGKIAWRRREFEKANLVQAGDKTILLDADGNLALVRLSPEGMTVLSRTTVGDGPTWTAPTLVGTTLFVRDKMTVRALDLGNREEP